MAKSKKGRVLSACILPMLDKYEESGAWNRALGHYDIRITFTLGGRLYEAVGFLQMDEDCVDGNVMSARVEKDGRVLRDYRDEYSFLRQRLKWLPPVLSSFDLVTMERDPLDQEKICYFSKNGGSTWSVCTKERNAMWYKHCLVLRLLPETKNV